MSTWIPTTGIPSKVRLDDVPIVDLDVHLLEDLDQIASYCEQPYRRIIEERQPIPPFGGNARLFPNYPGQWDPRRPVSLTAETMRADLDALSIDLAVLFPERGLGLARQPDLAYAHAVAQAYNRWIMDKYLPTRGFYGGIIVAPQDPEGAAREIERYAKEERVVGVVLPTSGVNPLWGDRKYDPIYEVAQAADIAVMFHAGGSLMLPVLPFDLRQLDSWFSQHTYSHNIALMASLTNLLSTGVPVRFPKLRMIFIEAGISWVLHLMQRLDRAWEDHRDERLLLTEPPSTYMRHNMYFATQPIEEPESLRDMAEVIRLMGGEDTVLFASDYPHHDFDHPKKIYDIPVSVEVKRKIMGENALRALGIAMPDASQRVPRPALVER
jgi:predicted TIM-barrel fold metal-dependent hydrolase